MGIYINWVQNKLHTVGSKICAVKMIGTQETGGHTILVQNARALTRG